MIADDDTAIDAVEAQIRTADADALADQPTTYWGDIIWQIRHEQF